MTLTHSEIMAIVEPGLQHHGVKGMHWGRHIKTGAVAGVTAVGKGSRITGRAVKNAPKKALHIFEQGELNRAGKKVNKWQKKTDKRVDRIRKSRNKSLAKVDAKYGDSTKGQKKTAKITNSAARRIRAERSFTYDRQVERVARINFAHLQRRNKYTAPEVRAIMASAIRRAAADMAVATISEGKVKTSFVANSGKSITERKRKKNQSLAYAKAQKQVKTKNFTR